MKSPEKFEKLAIKKYLDANNFWHFSPYMAGFGKSGVPDILALRNGVLVTIEVKRPGKSPTPIQERRMLEIQTHGGYAVWGTAEKVIVELKMLFK